MKSLMKKIETVILDNDNTTNKKIIGINFLERLKYPILTALKAFDKSSLEKITQLLQNENDYSIKSELKNCLIKYSISYYKDSLFKIKSSYDSDTLTILVDGYKTISLFDFHENKRSVSLTIRKNMGIVLSKNTITAENIASGTIILDINSEKTSLGVEN